MEITHWFYNKNIFVRDNFALLDFKIRYLSEQKADVPDTYIVEWVYELMNLDELIIRCVIEDKFSNDQNVNAESIGYFIVKSFMEASKLFHSKKKETGANFAEITPPNLCQERSKFIFAQVVKSVQ